MLILAQVRGQDEAHARFIVDNENSSHPYVFFSFSSALEFMQVVCQTCLFAPEDRAHLS